MIFVRADGLEGEERGVVCARWFGGTTTAAAGLFSLSTLRVLLLLLVILLLLLSWSLKLVSDEDGAVMVVVVVPVGMGGVGLLFAGVSEILFACEPPSTVLSESDSFLHRRRKHLIHNINNSF